MTLPTPLHTAVTRMPASPEPLLLLDDLALFEHGDPGSRPFGMSTNSYALLKGDRALLVDASFDYLVPSIRALAERGSKPVGMVLLHRHLLVGNHKMLDAFGAEYGPLPIFLHPLDADYAPDADPRAAGHPLENVAPREAAPGTDFQNPVGSSLLAEFGVEALHFPGHTAGSVLLYREDGLVLSGDAAMSTTVRGAAEGTERLIRGPTPFNVDDALLRQSWLEFGRPVTHFAPYHGRTAYLHRSPAAMTTIMRPLLCEEPTQGMDG